MCKKGPLLSLALVSLPREDPYWGHNSFSPQIYVIIFTVWQNLQHPSPQKTESVSLKHLKIFVIMDPHYPLVVPELPKRSLWLPWQGKTANSSSIPPLGIIASPHWKTGMSLEQPLLKRICIWPKAKLCLINTNIGKDILASGLAFCHLHT